MVLVVTVDISKEELSDNLNTKNWNVAVGKSIKSNRIFEPMFKKTSPRRCFIFLQNWIFQTLSSMKCLQEGFMINVSSTRTVQRLQICL